MSEQLILMRRILETHAIDSAISHPALLEADDVPLPFNGAFQKQASDIDGVEYEWVHQIEPVEGFFESWMVYPLGGRWWLQFHCTD